MRRIFSKSNIKTAGWVCVSLVMITSTTYYHTGAFKASVLAAVWANIIKTPIYRLYEGWMEALFNRQSVPAE